MRRLSGGLWGFASPAFYASLLLLSNCTRQLDKPSPSIIPPPQTTYNQRLETYAAILNNTLFSSDDRQNAVVRATVGFRPGTVLIGGRDHSSLCTIPDAAFPPPPDPPVVWNPPVGSDTQFKFGFDLPANIIGGLASAGAKANIGSSSSLEFDGMTLHSAFSGDFGTAIADPACQTKISQAFRAGKTVTIVRGVISGKMKFMFNQGGGFGAQAKVSQVGDFNVGLTANNVAVNMTETNASVHFLLTFNIPPVNAVPTNVSPPVPLVNTPLLNTSTAKFLPSPAVLDKIQKPAP